MYEKPAVEETVKVEALLNLGKWGQGGGEHQQSQAANHGGGLGGGAS